MALPDGGESSMAQEAPKEEPKEEPREVGEKAAESFEAPEAAKRVEDATIAPEAVVEREGSYELSETIEKTFVEVVEAPIAEAAPAQVMEEPSATLEQKDGSEGPPGPPRTDRNNMEIPTDPRGEQPTLDRVAAPEVSDAQGALTQESEGLPEGIIIPDEDSGPELKLVNKDDDGKLDMGVKEVVDLHKPNPITDGLKDGMQDGVREGGSYLGAVDHFGLGEPGDKSRVDLDPKTGLPGGRDLPGPGEIPGHPGAFPTPDLQGIKAGALPGGDPRVGKGGGLPKAPKLEMPKPGSEPEQEGTNPTEEEMKELPLPGPKLEEKKKAEPSTSSSSSSSSGSGSGGSGSGGSDSGGLGAQIVRDVSGAIRTIIETIFGTPNPEGGDEPAPYHDKWAPPKQEDPYEEYLKGLIMPEADQPLDLKESMMQPVDPEGYGADRPMKAITLEQAMSGNLDPYVNWGDDGGGLSTGGVVPDDLDPDGNLIDPPDFAGGGPLTGQSKADP